MKKSFFKQLSVVFFGLAFCVYSCQDATDIRQTSEVPAETAITNVADMELAITGAYTLLAPDGEIRFVSTFTDELSIGVENGGQGISNDALYYYNLNPTTGEAGGIWGSNYRLIRQVNRILEAAETITPEGDYDRIVATCYAMRAYAYNKLLIYYSTDMTNDNALGVPLVDFVPVLTNPDDAISLPRSTVAEIGELIEEDIATAQSFFATDTEDNEDRFLFDGAVVSALEARYLLYRGRTLEAATIANSLYPTFQLSTGAEYTDMWEDNNASEIIFKLDRTQNDTQMGNYFANRRSNSGGAPIFEMGRSLYNVMDPDGARAARYLDASSSIDQDYENSDNPRATDVLIVDKYPGNDSFDQVNDLMAFRSVELLFIIAEFNIENAAYPDAQNVINFIRQNRGTGPVFFSNEEDAYAALLEERRIELWLEGHRYIDMKRLGAKANSIGFVKDPIDCEVANSSSNCNLDISVDSFKLTLPIPVSELAGNPVINQNPNY